MPARPHPSQATAFAVAWLAYFTALQWSVVRFRVAIVVVLVASALALALWQWRRARVELVPQVTAAMLAGSALATLTVPLFSYLSDSGLALASTLLVAGPLGSAALLWSGRERPALVALGTTVVTYAAAVATAVVSDPAPRIDVWVTLQQASDALARGESFYEVEWTGSPGIQDAFTYLPWTAVLLAPGRWLAGDVRWALLVWSLVAALAVWVLATRLPRGRAAQGPGPAPRWRGAAAVALLLFAPGTLTQADQAWTEPLLLAGLLWWAVLVDRGRAWWAVLPLAVACASKQHLALLLPVLLLWRPFGARRAVATGAVTGVLIAPWFLAGPSAFVHDTITLLVSFHPIRFANTLYLLALNSFGVTLPFWLTGLVALGTLAGVMVLVWRRQPGLPELLRWLALVLLVANLVNKQAFYNQFWLVGALVVASLALPREGAPAGSDGRVHESAAVSRRS
ncbi:MAG TPA: hypothetical protein VIB11_04940 [Pedococcus sp.]|jgi:hypothetical protein|uniref:hypothetical protein n=1 Tax=Pedococcus sp. TaxID=2860345 RepID=UPI002F93903A